MTSIFCIETKSGKHRGILSIYILHSIKNEPKTGYDLIAEIKEKTEGAWIPSKGTIYPLLKHLNEENLITIKQVGERSKQIFMITKDGEKTLKNAKKQGKKIEENFLKFRKLFSEIAEIKNKEIVEHMVNIRMLSVSKSMKNSDDVKNILKNCVNNLKKI